MAAEYQAPSFTFSEQKGLQIRRHRQPAAEIGYHVLSIIRDRARIVTALKHNHNMDNDVLARVFSFLRHRDASLAKLVSRHWRSLLEDPHCRLSTIIGRTVRRLIGSVDC